VIKVRQPRRDPQALTGSRGRRGPPVRQARWGPLAKQDLPGPASSSTVHVVRYDTCQDDKCELACNAGEQIASVTCPSGTISIGRNSDVESASCANSPGPVMAMCLKP
jgi:hypothetical protein